MPLPRDQRLYYEQQAKMQQQQVDYENMHTRSTIVRGVQGKVSKIDEEMYHPEMRRVSFEKEATIRHHAAGDFLPIKQENPHARMQPPAQLEQGTLPSLNDFARQLREGVQAFNRVAFDNETQRSHRNLLRDAPNQNPSVRLIGDSYNNTSDPMDTSDDIPTLANVKRKRENGTTFVENMRGSRKKARITNRKRFDVDLSGQKRSLAEPSAPSPKRQKKTVPRARVRAAAAGGVPSKKRLRGPEVRRQGPQRKQTKTRDTREMFGLRQGRYEPQESMQTTRSLKRKAQDFYREGMDQRKKRAINRSEQRITNMKRGMNAGLIQWM